jgi:hypothetical protein
VGLLGVGDVEHHQPAMAAQILNGFCRTSRTLPRFLPARALSVWNAVSKKAAPPQRGVIL